MAVTTTPAGQSSANKSKQNHQQQQQQPQYQQQPQQLHVYIVSELEWDESDTEITSDIKILGCFTTKEAANECVKTWHERAYVPCAKRDFDKYVVSRDPEGLLHLTVAKEWLCWEVAAEVVPVDREFTMSLMEPGVGLEDEIVPVHPADAAKAARAAAKARGGGRGGRGRGGRGSTAARSSGGASRGGKSKSRRRDDDDDEEDDDATDSDSMSDMSDSSDNSRNISSAGGSRSLYGTPGSAVNGSRSNAASPSDPPPKKKIQKRTGKPDLVQQHNRKHGGWAAIKQHNLEQRGLKP